MVHTNLEATVRTFIELDDALAIAQQIGRLKTGAKRSRFGRFWIGSS